MEDQGKITKKDTKTGRSGGNEWTRVAYTINGKIYSTFDTKLRDFKEGDLVKLEYNKSEDGKFNNITSMMLLEANKQIEQPIQVNVEKIEEASIWEKKDMRIAKMNAIKESANMLNTIALTAPQYLIEAFKQKDPFVYLVERAKELLDYIYE